QKPNTASESGETTRNGEQWWLEADVKQHASLADRVWVTYAGEVFDITEFVELHPGGIHIMLAAGGALDEHVIEILQEYKVGELRPEEKIKHHQKQIAKKGSCTSNILLRRVTCDVALQDVNSSIEMHWRS
uniref:Cytochrome b5 heme-binding domain-containing protein n=1 Tax=Leptobrachium leishanense TaxID=445787 RepID=A0A8C5MTC5_9ANUR